MISRNRKVMRLRRICVRSLRVISKMRFMFYILHPIPTERGIGARDKGKVHYV
jgi:hypothetical protein